MLKVFAQRICFYFAYDTFYKFALFGFNMLLASVMDGSDFGRYALFIVFGNVLFVLGDLGSSQHYIKLSKLNRLNLVIEKIIIWRTLNCSLVLSCFFILNYLFNLIYLDVNDTMMMIAFVFSLAFNVEFHFVYSGKAKELWLPAVIFSLAMFSIFLVLNYLQLMQLIMLAIIVPNIIFNFLILRYLPTNWSSFFATFKKWTLAKHLKHLIGSMQYGVAAIANLGITQLPVILVGANSSPDNAGAVFLFQKIIQFIVFPLNYVFVMLVSLYRDYDAQKIHRIGLNIVLLFSTIVLFVLFLAHQLSMFGKIFERFDLISANLVEFSIFIFMLPFMMIKMFLSQSVIASTKLLKYNLYLIIAAIYLSFSINFISAELIKVCMFMLSAEIFFACCLLNSYKKAFD